MIENQIINEESGETEDALVALEETEVTPLLFKTKGFQKMPVWDLVKGLKLPELLSWSDSRAFPMNAVITGTPPKQYVECMADLSNETVLGIKALNAEYTGEVPYLVKVSLGDLNIRKGPGTNYARTQFIPRGVYTIVEEADGKGATKWGRLKSGAGWISLDYVTKL